MKTGKLIMMAALCLGFCLVAPDIFAFGGGKFKSELDTEAAAVKLLREVQRGDYGIVTTEELHKMLQNKEDVLIIDTMPYEDSYKKNHIPTARQFLFPIPEMTEWNMAGTAGKTQEDFSKLLGPDKSRKIVFYCGFVKCTRSHNGAMWARKLGYENVYRQPGGIFAWKGADYDIETEE